MATQTLKFNTIQPATTVRWGSGSLLALALHAGVIVWMSYHALDSSIEAPPPAMMLMVADSVQSTSSPQDAPVGPQQTLSTPQASAAQPEKIMQDVPPLAPAPKPVITTAQKEKPQPQKKMEKPVQETTPQEAIAPSEKPPAPVTSAPLPGNSQHIAAPYNSDAAQMRKGVADWSSKLLAHLSRHKRYPAQAARQRLQGVAQIRVTLDRTGNVLAVSLVSSSGVAPLDTESVALPKRAQPLPAPPAEVIGDNAQLTITIPISFDLREARR
ncbi:TonB family protein [Pectobacterium atrosepticum]|uniref:TonB family protein n=1 Tax=Pectobacterium atrosepticum TaxID=29471 RepID=UPI00039E387F|nr:energy transducer TonB [Pectobacterium atrosepticum]ATY88933.1 energy transducer TonB [Pectobacterium atrosepticum]KFX24312.1 energy transducer TonB [Pectobacterium atrosepticum]MBL0893278.1 energy transducer TonB [Pectobacterium atrosepticum]MCA6977610.1 energy transducer TonB [Pectobacterium atrosepticum]MCH5018809.1 energy transducer TonB [Pectobacterium atrosepticum]